MCLTCAGILHVPQEHVCVLCRPLTSRAIRLTRFNGSVESNLYFLAIVLCNCFWCMICIRSAV